MTPALRSFKDECRVLYARLFPRGLAGDDVMSELSLEGWAQSALSRVLDHTAEQVFKETTRIRVNLSALAIALIGSCRSIRVRRHVKRLLL